MPHQRVLPLQFTPRFLSTFAPLRPRYRFLLTHTRSIEPILPFLWPTLSHRSGRKLSTTCYRRAHDHSQGYGEHDDDMAEEGKGRKAKAKEGKGNFQLKTPKGTRDCMDSMC